LLDDAIPKLESGFWFRAAFSASDAPIEGVVDRKMRRGPLIPPR
jgi:hypothetical protein